MKAHRELFAYFTDMVQDRQGKDGSDLISVLMQTRVAGRTVDPGEVISNCYSLLLGANITTPHMPVYVMAEQLEAGVLNEWASHPDLTETAVEEGLRLASPVAHFMRV